MQADIVSIDDIANQMGYALQGQVETDLAGLPDGLGSYTRGVFGQPLTMDLWESIWGDLQLGLAPLEDRFAWLSSAGISEIRKLGNPISQDYTKANIAALDEATLGKFLGFKIIESQYLESPATGQHDCCAFKGGKDGQFITIRQQEPKVERDRIIGDLSTLVVAWELFVTAEREIIAEASGSETLTDKYGVWVKTV